MNGVDIDVCSIPKRKVFTLRSRNHYRAGIGHLKKCNKSNKTHLKKCVFYKVFTQFREEQTLPAMRVRDRC